MVERGFSYAPPPQTSGPGAHAYPQVHNTIAFFSGVTLGIRYRVSPVIAEELQVGVRLPETVNGLDNLNRRYITATNLPLSVSLLTKVRRGVLAFGAGPSVVIPNWKVREDHQHIYYYHSSSFWSKSPNETVSASSAAAAFGGSAEVVAQLPMMRARVAELRLQSLIASKSKLPATPAFPTASASNRHLSIALTLGTGW
jgi:hypothetical protein